MADTATVAQLQVGRKSRRTFDRRWVLVPATFVVVIVAWDLAVRIFSLPSYLFPSPLAVWDSLSNMVVRQRFWENVGVTVSEAIGGYVIGVVAAVVLGVLISEWKFLQQTIYPYVIALNAVPKTALAPLFVAWLGFGPESKLLTAALVALFPVLVNVIEGLRASNPAQIELIRVADGSNWQIFRYVKVPNALPFFFAGLEIAIVMALTGAVVAEWVGAKSGLGQQMLQYIYEFNIAGMFAVLVVVSLLGFFLDLAVRIAQRRIVFWVE